MYIGSLCTSRRMVKVVVMDKSATDHAIAEARANLSDLLAAVRLLSVVRFLTSRGKRQAALVPVELGELVEAVGGPERAVEILRPHAPAAPDGAPQ
jgi:antitoxin (DNA-binding transcriptional repressor) of toxin-antitoxin stability system